VSVIDIDIWRGVWDLNRALNLLESCVSGPLSSRVYNFVAACGRVCLRGVYSELGEEPGRVDNCLSVCGSKVLSCGLGKRLSCLRLVVGAEQE
jgi:hypothetical protein